MAELQARMSSQEFAEWMAYAQIEPFGGSRADLRFAMIATLIAGIAGVKGFDPYDFLPFMEKPEPDPDVMSREALRPGARRPGRDPEPDPEKQAASNLYAEFKTWATIEQLKAGEVEKVKNGDPV